jgi:hypothetical protein
MKHAKALWTNREGYLHIRDLLACSAGTEDNYHPSLNKSDATPYLSYFSSDHLIWSCPSGKVLS